MSNNGFVQVPPNSTGKKIATVERTEIFFDQQVGNINVGDIVTGATSNATGTVKAVQTEGYPLNSGELYLDNAEGTFLNDESLQISNVEVAKINHTGAQSQITLDVQKVVLTDADNLERTQKIDRFGATVNTFTEGAPIFGPFNSLQVGEPITIKEYGFNYDEMASSFYTQTSGGGVSGFDTNRGLSLVTCGTTTGDLVKRTTHYYHPYSAGHGTILMTSIQIGDTGKTNVRRRWGYYDNNNGLFFELDGTDLYVVLRSDTSGSPVDTRILQSDWNRDRCDGSDAIGFNLDVSKPNIYWIDFQWLGAGVARFGVYEPDGSRIICHIEEHANTGLQMPYTRTASLPFRYEQENTGTSISTSEMAVNSGVVLNTSAANRDGIKHAESSGIKTVSSGGGEIPLITFRPKTTMGGKPNHHVWKGLSYTIANITGTGNAAVIFRIRAGTTAALTGSSFASHSADSITEVDTSASAINTALTKELNINLCLSGESRFAQDIAPRELHTFELYLQADETTQPCLIITAECLNGTSADVWTGINWEELLS